MLARPPERGRESYYFAPIAGAERRLWAALVADAVGICLGQTLVPRDERMAARRWIEARSQRVGGFVWCCHLLGLDEGAIAERIAGADGRTFALEGRGRPSLRYSRPRRYRAVGAGSGAATTFVADSVVRSPLKSY
jgi:hypothetical protein